MSMFSLNHQKIEFSRRAFILLALKASLVLVILVRLMFLQLFKGKEYKDLSDKNRIKIFFLEPPRGDILDKNGMVLATNIPQYKLYIYKQRGIDYKPTLQTISSVLEQATFDSEKLRKIEKAKNIYPVLLNQTLSWKEVSRIEANIDKMQNIYIEKGYRRMYKLDKASSNILGYLGMPDTEFLKRAPKHLSEFKVGKTGVEKFFNAQLFGVCGRKKVEVDASGRILQNLDYTPSSQGQNINLMMDARLQKFAYEQLAAYPQGTAVVLDLTNFGVLSMVSVPGFDPHKLSGEFDQQYWNASLNNPSYPLINKATSKLYPPGSAWKIITALAAMAANIDQSHSVVCTGSKQIGNRVYKCWKEHGHGRVDFEKAFAGSCSIYYYTLGQMLGIEKIHEVADALGFGKRTGIDFMQDLAGVNPTKEWVKKTYDVAWMPGDTINSSIGQGYTLVTPLQLANMVASIAVGKRGTPRLIRSDKIIEYKELNIKEEHLLLVRNLLAQVFTNPIGTCAGLGHLVSKDFPMAGKTGTAQVISQDTQFQKYSQTKSHALFVGYAPVGNPRYAVSVIVDNAGWGAKAAAPIGIKILNYARSIEATAPTPVTPPAEKTTV